MIRRVVRRISSSIFIGRVSERAQLEAGLDAAEQGEPGLVLLGGEAGIGKTRIVAELTAMATARSAPVVRGHCLVATAASLPFAPFVEVLRGLLLGEGSQGHAGTGEPGTAALARLVPEIDTQQLVARRPSTEDERLRLFYSVLEVLGQAASDRPLVVVVEDLHWADASSLDLLRFIAGELAIQRLLLIGTFRTDELHRRHPLLPVLAELVRLPHVMRLDLGPLAEAEVADQLTGILGSRPADTVVEHVFSRSDGNPFFVEELAGQGTDNRLQASLRDVLAARLGMLSPNARGVVLAAAAIGREASHELIARVAALPPDRLLDALQEAIDHHVLVQADPGASAGFAFRHALIQELAYGELLPSQRVALHGTIVASLLDAGGSSAEIAHHALLGHDLPTGLVHSVAAADHAFESVAFAEALAHIERALELWGRVGEPESLTGRDQASLLRLAARCAGALGRWSLAADLGRTALSHLDPIERRDERITLLLDLARWEMLDDNEVARAAVVHEASELVPSDTPSALLARVLSERAFLANNNGRAEEARILAEEAIVVARAAGAPAEEARALVRLAEAIGTLMQSESSERLLAEAHRIAAEGHAPSDDFEGHVVFRQADGALSTGAFAKAVEIADAGSERAARVGRFAERSGFLRALKINALAALGRWDEAEELVIEARRGGATVTMRMAVQNFLEVLIRQGRAADAAAAVHETDFAYVSSEDGGVLLWARIHVATSEGRWDDARAAADEALGLFHDPAHESGALAILGLAVGTEADRAEFARGRRRPAEESEARRVGISRLELLRRGAQDAILLGGAGPLIEAVLATAEAEGSRLEGSSNAALWDEAARRRDALDQPWESAYARFRKAEALLAMRGHKAEALPLLRDAHRIASGLGARPLVDQIERLARRGRLRLAQAEPRARQATTPEGVVVALTTREWEVLSMVATGHTNREIGEELFISEKTASVHITNAMDKLGALSRYDAAASATRLGLLDPTEGAGGALRMGLRQN